MTFSLVARCPRTGMFGVAVTTSSICVGARCPHVRAGVGSVSSQNVTDPNLANLVLDRMQAGKSSRDAVAEVVEGRENIAYRQLSAVDVKGNTAHFTGENILGTNAVVEGEGCVAAGNLLSSIDVAASIVRSFETNPNAHLAERLLQGLEGGLAAGGEMGDVHSAAVVVADKMPFALVDLRVDWDENNPVAVLRKLWADYEPQMQDYLNRAINPQAAPSYGVLGDL